ncbi:hypothetical protein CDD83_889 [Cordyceps sp. RAO-2017]|nr:hypothetical protein CDD83_889 [Cordyceps sp. RAO-2017]
MATRKTLVDANSQHRPLLRWFVTGPPSTAILTLKICWSATSAARVVSTCRGSTVRMADAASLDDEASRQPAPGPTPSRPVPPGIRPTDYSLLSTVQTHRFFGSCRMTAGKAATSSSSSARPSLAAPAPPRFSSHSVSTYGSSWRRASFSARAALSFDGCAPMAADAASHKGRRRNAAAGRRRRRRKCRSARRRPERRALPSPCYINTLRRGTSPSRRRRISALPACLDAAGA